MDGLSVISMILHIFLRMFEKLSNMICDMWAYIPSLLCLNMLLLLFQLKAFIINMNDCMCCVGNSNAYRRRVHYLRKISWKKFPLILL